MRHTSSHTKVIARFQKNRDFSSDLCKTMSLAMLSKFATGIEDSLITVVTTPKIGGTLTAVYEWEKQTGSIRQHAL